MKVLNLYAGLGGNRADWKDVTVTAVELDEQVAAFYAEKFPDDEVIVGDAHDYLLHHFKEYDFIWASPPCPSHSKVRAMASKRGDYDVIYPDMKLWQEIILLRHFAKIKPLWVVENVIPYYEPLISPSVKIDRHFFWTNFPLNPGEFAGGPKICKVKVSDTRFGFRLNGQSFRQSKVKLLRNLINPAIGRHILESARLSSLQYQLQHS